MNEPAPEAPATAFERARPWLPAIVFVVALALRVWGIGWGLPNEKQTWSYHPDEAVIYAYAQQVEPAKLDFEPGFYNYGTLYLTVLRVAGDVAKTYSGAGDRDWAQMRAAHLAGRWISALAGAGMAAVAFLILRRRFQDVAALFGAGLVAFAPGLVVHSRFQTVDVLAAFFLILSAHHALRLLPDRLGQSLEGKVALQAALLSGLFAGLSAGTKYTGILALATLAVVLIVERRKEAVRLGGLGVAVALAAFLVVTPGVFLNSQKFLTDFRYEIQHSSTGHGLVFAGLPSGFVWHFYNLIVGVGPLLLLLGLIGLGWSAVRKDRAALALGAFFVLYYVLIGRAEVVFLRYTFPLVIGLAYGLGWLIDRFWVKPGWARVTPALAMLGLGGVMGGGLAASGVTSVWMSGVDPRDEVAAYFHKPEFASATVGLVADPWFYTPPFYPEVGAPRFVPFERQVEWLAKATGPKLIRVDRPAEEGGRFDWDTKLLDAKPDFVVFSSFEAEGLDRLRTRGGGTDLEKLLVSRYVAFGERLKKEYDLAATFGGTGWKIHDMEYIRPFYWVWKRKGHEVRGER